MCVCVCVCVCIYFYVCVQIYIYLYKKKGATRTTDTSVCGVCTKKQLSVQSEIASHPYLDAKQYAMKLKDEVLCMMM